MWSWQDNNKIQENREYIEEKEEPKHQEEISSTPQQSSRHPSPQKSSSRRIHKNWSIQELLDVTRHLDANDYSMFCLFAGCDPIEFHDANKKEKWRKAMHEEILSIEKNDI